MNGSVLAIADHDNGKLGQVAPDESRENADADLEGENEDDLAGTGDPPPAARTVSVCLIQKVKMLTISAQYLESLIVQLKQEEDEANGRINSLRAPKVLPDLNILQRLRSGSPWIQPPSPPASLIAYATKHPNDDLSPHFFYRPDVYFFVPHLVFSLVPRCPGCKSNTNVAPRGWPSNPLARSVCDLDRVFYIIGYRYECSSCTRTFYSHGSDCLKLFPTFLQHDFPAHLYKKVGVSKRFSQIMLSISITKTGGNGPSVFSDLMEQCARQRYDEQKLAYYSACLYLKQRSLEQAEQGGLKEAVGPRPDRDPALFSDFADVNGYCGRILSRK